MSSTGLVVGVTGANGYLGGVLLGAFEREGWDAVALVQPSRANRIRTIPYDLSLPLNPAALRGVDVLVHCAYDLSQRSPRDIWRVNVEGTERLLAAARTAGIRRSIVLSSIAAFPGTRQLYGRAKLAIEAVADKYGAIVVRPGLVFGPHAGGLMGAMRRSLKSPVVPLLSPHSYQFLIHEDDLARAIIHLAGISKPPAGPITVAHPEPITVRLLLESMAAGDSRRVFLIPFPWRLAFLGLKALERLGMKLAFRSDSVWGLAHPVPQPAFDALHVLDIRPRRFPTGPPSSTIKSGLPEAAVAGPCEQ